MEKLVAAFGFGVTMIFFTLMFFFGNQYLWGVCTGGAITGIGLLFSSDM